ncbi:MAG: ATP-dependent metallopeptidase FtsH/Yme1/Tma family protein [Betaproteobacteria bacterium]|nr:ATP-dependent metallopeptidase FtsH/Yme1/Tma family protein [Betaproteobacteria bacterium]
MIAAVLLIVLLVIEQADQPGLTPYSAFLDQLDAGNVASVTFQGTEIGGRYKHPSGSALPSGTNAGRDTFRSRVPDFGDPMLIPELRKQHIVINVSSPSQWSSLLTHLPWPEFDTAK